jgi:hypothetical protein
VNKAQGKTRDIHGGLDGRSHIRASLTVTDYPSNELWANAFLCGDRRLRVFARIGMTLKDLSVLPLPVSSAISPFIRASILIATANHSKNQAGIKYLDLPCRACAVRWT